MKLPSEAEVLEMERRVNRFPDERTAEDFELLIGILRRHSLIVQDQVMSPAQSRPRALSRFRGLVKTKQKRDNS